MKYKTKGIVFNYVKFRETSIISRIYTDEFGLKSYIINGVRSSKPRHPGSLFQPLTQLDMVVYNKMNASINRISEIKCHHPYRSIPYDILKSSVALFITEIFYRIIREEEVNRDLYTFIETSLNIFDESDTNYMNFHLQFLLKLTRFFGFAPENGSQMIREIKEVKAPSDVNENNLKFINMLLTNKYDAEIKINNDQRRELLALIIQYYQAHFDHLANLKSYRVLKVVFENK